MVTHRPKGESGGELSEFTQRGGRSTVREQHEETREMSAVMERVGPPRDGSAGGDKATLYHKIHAGLDHALKLLLADDSFPMAPKAASAEQKTPLVAWREVMGMAEDRREQIAQREARKAKKQQLKLEKEKKELAAEKEKEKQRQKEREKEEARQAKAEREAAKARPVVKTLDLSAAPSPVLTHSNSLVISPPLPLSQQVGNKSPKRPPLRRAMSLDSAKISSSEASTNDVLTRLQQAPLLEDVKAGTKKYTALVKWMDFDDGKNVDLSRGLKTLILKLQRDGHAAAGAKANGRISATSSPRSLPDLPSETLDDRLKREKMEKKRLRREAINKERQREDELQRRRSTGSNGVTNGKKRRLGGFVVDSDEEEYEEGESEESEEEYHSEDGEEDEEDEEEEEEDEEDAVEFKVKVPAPPTAVSNAPKPSPKSTTLPAEPTTDGQSLTATDQLKLVAARIREEQLTSDPAAVPTYLSYNSEGSGPIVKEEKKVTTPPAASSAKGKKRPLPSGDGSSVTSAIVLEDSDEDEDESYELQAKVASQAKPPQPAPKSSAKQPKKQRASPSKKGGGGAKLTSKAKTAVIVPKSSSSTKEAKKKPDSPSDDEAEFRTPNEDGSSTDADEDMFDLTEDDVYVVESILEIKPGRTVLNNSGRATKEADLFLVKWEGYDELTWEPDANIPNRLIQFFRDRELAKRACGYQIDKFLQRKVAKNMLTGKDEILYLIQWKNQPQAFWEIKSNLPEKTVIWLEKTSRASLAKPGTVLSGPSRKKSKI